MRGLSRRRCGAGGTPSPPKRRLRVSEFLAGCAAVGVGGTLTEDELRAEFARVDSNGGGVSERAAHSGHSPCAQPQHSPPGLLLTPRQVILFDEFCRWSAFALIRSS